jgi:hypothetical protein
MHRQTQRNLSLAAIYGESRNKNNADLTLPKLSFTMHFQDSGGVHDDSTERRKATEVTYYSSKQRKEADKI